MTVELYTMRIAWHDLLHAFEDPTHTLSRLTNDVLPDSDNCTHLTILTCAGVGIVRRQLAGIRHMLFGKYRYERGQFQTHLQFLGAIVGCVRQADAKRFREWYRLTMMLGDSGSNFMSGHYLGVPYLGMPYALNFPVHQGWSPRTGSGQSA